MAICKKRQYDIILLDPVLPNGSGLRVYKKIRNNCDYTPVIIISNKVFDFGFANLFC